MEGYDAREFSNARAHTPKCLCTCVTLLTLTHTHTHTHTHRVAKSIIGSDENQDIDLNTDLFMLYARLPGDLASAPNLQNHSPQNRAVSGMRFTLPVSKIVLVYLIMCHVATIVT